jgi:glycosyltransferase involved in cell wall biosynthesis
VKLIIQIPAYNEELTLPLVLGELPTSLLGFSSVEWLVIDDGSSDATAQVAHERGAHVIRHPSRRGLARAFTTGLEASITRGADIIVNTDADHQYRAEDIPALLAPILARQADIVIGARPIATIPHFSPLKRWFQRRGSQVTRAVSGTSVDDAPSGFRAMTREAAMRLHVYGNYTYTIETIIQAGRQGMRVVSVPVGINPDLRPSRLVRGMGSYIAKQLLTMIRVYVIYKPFRFFAASGALLFGAGLLVSLRFLYYFTTGTGSGHVQSLILASLLMGLGFLLGVAGLLADLLAVNRVLLEGLDWRLRRLESTKPHDRNS